MVSYDEERTKCGSISTHSDEISDALHTEPEHEQDSMLEAQMFGPKLKIWSRLPFAPLEKEGSTIQQSQLHIYSIQHDFERSTSGHLNVVKIMGTKIGDLI